MLLGAREKLSVKRAIKEMLRNAAILCVSTVFVFEWL